MLRGLAAITSSAMLVSLLAFIPLGFVLVVTAQTGLETASALILRPRVGELLGNTVLLVACTLPLCAVVAVALAWFTERTDLPGARLWAWLAVAPLAVPAFVHGYAWVSLWPGLHGLPAAVLVSVLAYSAFLYLPVSAALRLLDPALEDAAGTLGLPPWQVFLRVVLPQLRISLCAGSLLIGLHLLAEYGLYGTIRFDTFTTAIVDQYQSSFNGPAASMLAGVLVLFCLFLLGLEAWARGRARYARLGAGAARRRSRYRLGQATLPCMLLPAGFAAAAVGVPTITIATWLVKGGAGVWRAHEIGDALGQTIMLAGIGGLLTTAAAVPMAWLSVRHPSRFQRTLEVENTVAGALPGVVIALALVTLTVRVALPLYQSVVTILLAYVLLFLPRGLLSLRGSVAQAPVELERAAASLGRRPVAALWATTLRLAAPGAAAAVALVALGITTELTATMMLAPNGTETLATAFWAYSSEIDYTSAAPYALLMVCLALPLTWLLDWQSRRLAGR